jgi:UPF0716 protein FxsA
LPLVELIAFALVAGSIGLGNAIVIQLCASALGLIAMRVLAAAPLRDLLMATQMNQPPAGAMLRSACVLLGGLLLIVPGFITDLVGLVLILPGPRFWLGRLIWRSLRTPKPEDNTLEGTFREVTPNGSGPVFEVIAPPRRDLPGKPD